jgi:hypothetical protein
MPPDATANPRSAVRVRAPGTRTTFQSSGRQASRDANSVKPVGWAVKPKAARAHAVQASTSWERRAATSTVISVSEENIATTVSGRTPMPCGSHQARNTTASTACATERTMRRSGAHSAIAYTAIRRSARKVTIPKTAAGMRCSTGAFPTIICHQPSAW